MAIPAALHGSATKATAPMSHGCHGETVLVGGAITSLKNMKVNGKDDIPYTMENKKCLKPPTRLVYYVAVVALGFGMFWFTDVCCSCSRLLPHC